MRVIMMALAPALGLAHHALAPSLLESRAHAATKKPHASVSEVASEANGSPTAGKLLPVIDKELKLLKALDATYQAKSAEMKVNKTTKIPLLAQERKAQGTMWISNGKLRLELDGAEKSLLVVNKQNLWAITYPPAEFKDAPLQVIKANTGNKKARSQNFVGLLSQGGFLKFFTATGVQHEANGEVLFFLSPKREQTDFKRAQIVVSRDGKAIHVLNYWDDRDNETRLEFTDIKFEKALDEKLFNYAPPANADVMTI